MAKYKDLILYGLLILICFIFLMSKIIHNVSAIIKTNSQIKVDNQQAEKIEKEMSELIHQNEDKQTVQRKKIYKTSEFTDNVESSFAVMLDDIVNITKYNNIKVFSIQYTYNPPEDLFVSKSNGKYDACRIDLELISNYSDFKSLLIELLKYPYFIKINNFKVIPYQKDKRILLIQLQITLYVEKAGTYTPPQEPVPNKGNNNNNNNNNDDVIHRNEQQAYNNQRLGVLSKY